MTSEAPTIQRHPGLPGEGRIEELIEAVIKAAWAHSCSTPCQANYLTNHLAEYFGCPPEMFVAQHCDGPSPAHAVDVWSYDLR